MRECSRERPCLPCYLDKGDCVDKPIIGDRVMATMNGTDWFTGTLVSTSDILAEYGVQRDDTREVRFFVYAERLTSN